MEQLLKTAMMQTAIETKQTTDHSGDTPKAVEDETQPILTEGGTKRLKTDNVTIDRETFMALVQAVQELKSPVSSKRASSEDEELIEAMEE